MRKNIENIREKISAYVIFLCLLFFCQVVNASPIDESLARTVATNFLNYLGQGASSHQIDSIEAMDLASERIGFLVRLSPQGYILVGSESYPCTSESIFSTNIL